MQKFTDKLIKAIGWIALTGASVITALSLFGTIFSLKMLF